MKWKSLWRKVSFGGLGKTSALEKQLEVIVYWEKKAMVPNLLGTRDQFWEHNFSTDWEWGWGWENRRQSSGGNASSHGPGGRRLRMPDMRDIILAKQVSASFWIFFFSCTRLTKYNLWEMLVPQSFTVFLTMMCYFYWNSCGASQPDAAWTHAGTVGGFERLRRTGK